MKKELMNKVPVITITAQAFYGNRTVTKVREDALDAFIQGYIGTEHFNGKNVDRTIVPVPGTDNLVIIYNKFMEASALQSKERLLKEKNYHKKPLAVIPEANLEIYSRCIVCRIDEAGNLGSLQSEDYDKFMTYLAK